MSFSRAENSENSIKGNTILESKRLPSPVYWMKVYPCIASPAEDLGLHSGVEQAKTND